MMDEIESCENDSKVCDNNSFSVDVLNLWEGCNDNFFRFFSEQTIGLPYFFVVVFKKLS